ncbi:MAG: manganese efflux pump MntP family protein [Christensenellaceae bacterium]|jgi:putative Mn2+ efflux pump MntP
MTFLELLLVAVGVSMDAFAVGVSKGLALKKTTPKERGIVGAYFGSFQAIMPLIGYLLFSTLAGFIVEVDHWIAFILLAFIGGNMIVAAIKDDESTDNSLSFKAMLPLAIATSIDALAIGITFGALQVSILPAILLIGVTTFIISYIGVYLGGLFGAKYRAKAEVLGGAILIFIGLKILLEHLNLF